MRYLLLLLSFSLYAQTADIQSDFLEAQQLFEQKEYLKAKPLLRKYLAFNPSDLRAKELLGDVAAHTKQWDEALVIYQQLIKIAPAVANYHYKHGGVLGLKAFEVSKFVALTFIGDIRKSLETAARLDSSHIGARWGLIEYYIQLPGFLGGSNKAATVYANQLLAISPVDGHLALGYIAEYSDKPKVTERHFRAAVAVSETVVCYSKLAPDFKIEQKNNHTVDTLIEHHQKDVTANRLHYQLGKISAQYNLKLDEGLQCLTHYIENFSSADGVPKDWAYLRIAQIYLHKNEKSNAMFWVEKSLKSRSDFKEAKALKEKILNL